MDKSMAAGGLRRQQSGNQHSHLITLPSLDPHQPKGPAKGPVTLGYPHSHTHSPFLKTSRSAGRCRPRYTTMSAADGLHLNLPRAPDNTFDTAQPQGDSGRRDAKQAHSQLLGTVRAGGGGAAPVSPPTFATDPAHPLTPPPSRIQGN